MSDTADVQEGLVKIDAHKEYGDAIAATITGIHAFADYHSGWIDTKFMYEKPQITFVLDSPVGEIHATEMLSDITEANLYGLLNAFTQTEDPNNIDVRDLIGETVYVTPDDGFDLGTLWPVQDDAIHYDSDRKVVLKEPDRSAVNGDTSWRATEPRSVYWLNQQLRADFERHVEEHNGWVERRIDSVVTTDDAIEVRVEVTPDWMIHFDFDDSFKGRLGVREFAEKIERQPDIEQLEGSIVYLHPVRDLHHSLQRADFPIDALERWVISGTPHEEAEPPKKSLLERIFGFFTSSTKSIEVSTGGGSRPAKSANTYDLPDSCREPEQESGEPEETEPNDRETITE